MPSVVMRSRRLPYTSCPLPVSTMPEPKPSMWQLRTIVFALLSAAMPMARVDVAAVPRSRKSLQSIVMWWPATVIAVPVDVAVARPARRQYTPGVLTTAGSVSM